MNKEEIKVPEYVMEELRMGWTISKTPVELDEEHAKNIIGLLVMSDDSDESLTQKKLDAFEFIRSNGSYDYFYGVTTYDELAEVIVAFDTENDNQGYRASVFGNLPKEWANFIDIQSLAYILAHDERITLHAEWNAAIRVW